MKKYKHKNKSGFSIVEVVISLYIVSMGLLGVLSLVAQNIQAKTININTLVASQLAQEGLELVRNIRDTNWLVGNDWKLGAGADSASDIVQDGAYVIDYNATINDSGGNEVNNITDAGAQLYINGGYYNSTGAGTASPFYRLITVIDPGGEFVEVESHVRWQVGGQTYNYIASTYLYDW